MAHAEEITIVFLSIRDNKNLTTMGFECERADKITYSLSPAI
jgi:hypothetical protein